VKVMRGEFPSRGQNDALVEHHPAERVAALSSRLTLGFGVRDDVAPDADPAELTSQIGEPLRKRPRALVAEDGEEISVASRSRVAARQRAEEARFDDVRPARQHVARPLSEAGQYPRPVEAEHANATSAVALFGRRQ
jgi:hypothetical protein